MDICLKGHRICWSTIGVFVVVIISGDLNIATVKNGIWIFSPVLSYEGWNNCECIYGKLFSNLHLNLYSSIHGINCGCCGIMVDKLFKHFFKNQIFEKNFLFKMNKYMKLQNHAHTHKNKFFSECLLLKIKCHSVLICL